MQRSARLFFGLAFLMLGVSGARADDSEDCFSTGSRNYLDPNFYEIGLQACSRLIASGRRTGPSLAAVYTARGDWKHKKGDLDAALLDLNESVRIDPKNHESYDYRADVHQKKRDWDRAIADYNTAIRLKPTYPAAHYSRGRVYEYKGDHERARSDYFAALALPAKDRIDRWAHMKANVSLCRAFKRSREFERAIDHCTKGIEVDPLADEAYSQRADTHADRGQYDRAIADYGKAIEISPKTASYYNARAWSYFKLGKASEGLPDAERSLELRPNDASTLDTRGHIFEALGRREEAIADFRRALSKDPEMQGSKDGLKRLGAQP
jgi:tetratricopeptide (TPR) repeat protein